MRAKRPSRDPRSARQTYTTGTGVHVDVSGGAVARKRAPAPAGRAERRGVARHRPRRVLSALGTAAAIGVFALIGGLYGDLWPADTAPAAVSVPVAPMAAVAAPESAALPVQTPHTTAAPSVQEEVRVWLPKSGQRYHAHPACSGMRDAVEAPLAQAKAQGYTPCKRCHPPE